MINDLRKKKLKLRPVTYLSGSQGSESDTPHGYIWSPHLVPKPKGTLDSNLIVESRCYISLNGTCQDCKSKLNRLSSKYDLSLSFSP